MASCVPVEAPDGTLALAVVESESSTSTMTVGLPRESRIWRARTSRTVRLKPRTSAPARKRRLHGPGDRGSGCARILVQARAALELKCTRRVIFHRRGPAADNRGG